MFERCALAGKLSIHITKCLRLICQYIYWCGRCVCVLYQTIEADCEWHRPRKQPDKQSMPIFTVYAICSSRRFNRIYNLTHKYELSAPYCDFCTALFTSSILRCAIKFFFLILLQWARSGSGFSYVNDNNRFNRDRENYSEKNNTRKYGQAEWFWCCFARKTVVNDDYVHNNYWLWIEYLKCKHLIAFKLSQYHW